MTLNQDARAARLIARYRWIYSGCIIVLSLPAVTGGDAGVAARWLGTVEIAAALLFLFRRTQRAGFWLLLGVFTVAGLHHLAEGEVPFELALYAASAWLVVALDRVSAAVDG